MDEARSTPSLSDRSLLSTRLHEATVERRKYCGGAGGVVEEWALKDREVFLAERGEDRGKSPLDAT